MTALLEAVESLASELAVLGDRVSTLESTYPKEHAK
jgi:hypothetical protein